MIINATKIKELQYDMTVSTLTRVGYSSTCASANAAIQVRASKSIHHGMIYDTSSSR